MSQDSTIQQKKHIARFAVLEATRTNLLPHISEVKCHDCSGQAVHYHHEDYDKPLAVTPLCAQCHSNRHNKEMKERYQTDAAAIFQRENNTDSDNGDGISFRHDTLEERAKIEIAKHGTILALSKSIGVNPGVIYRVMHGGNSPTLRRLWDIPKNPPVPRLIINGCPPELKAAYLAMCVDYDMTRVELLSDMIEVYSWVMDKNVIRENG